MLCLVNNECAFGAILLLFNLPPLWGGQASSDRLLNLLEWLMLVLLMGMIASDHHQGPVVLPSEGQATILEITSTSALHLLPLQTHPRQQLEGGF